MDGPTNARAVVYKARAHLLRELEPLGLHVGGGPRGHQRRDGARRHHRTRGARRRMKGGAGGEQREHAAWRRTRVVLALG